MGTKGGLDPEMMVNAINAGSGRNGGTLALVHLAVELGVPMWLC
jgi:hypothetical protein